MTDKPIIFSASMIRALLDGRKTQTRRVLKPPYGTLEYTVCGELKPICTKFFPSDRLWVREAFSITNDGCAPSWLSFRADPIGTRATPCSPGKAYGSRTEWKSPIHMPRWASRLTLTVTDVRVQRVQEISEADAMAEGCECDTDGWRDYQFPATQCCVTARDSYRSLWNSIHGPGAWGANPWVAAISFTVERRNIDEVAG